MSRRQRISFCGGLALLLAGMGSIASPRLASAAEKPGAIITVEATYPGANAEILVDTVAAPIEQQVNGVENMTSMWSRCTNEGKYTLHVAFKPGTDLSQAQVLIQNRVALAQPMLPDVVVKAGVIVAKTSRSVAMILCLSSPDGRRDRLFLSGCMAQRSPEVLRLPDVSESIVLGACDRYSVRLSLDPGRMAAHKVTAEDVLSAIRAGAAEKATTPASQARPPDVAQFANIIVKTTSDGRLVRVKDMAQIVWGEDPRAQGVTRNGKPAVVEIIFPSWQAHPAPSWPARLFSAPPDPCLAVRKILPELRAELPKDVRLDMAFESTPNPAAGRPEYLLVAPVFPAGAAAERIREILTHFQARLRGVKSVQDVLTLSDNPFDRFHNQACMLLRLAPADAQPAGREEAVGDIRARLAQVNEAAVRIRALSGPSRPSQSGYPVEMAICDRGNQGYVKLTELADKLAQRLRQSKKLSDVWASPARRPGLFIDIDREKAGKLGVSVSDIVSTLQTGFGSVDIKGRNQFGRAWQVTVTTETDASREAADLGKLMVRSANGQMVALGSVATLRKTEQFGVLDRLDMYPAVEVTANPAPGVSPAEVRALAETLMEQVRKELGLPDTYRLQWL